MNNFLEITSNDNWFKQHPEKIAGVEYETTSFYFPIMVKGTKEDVLRVTGMSEEDINYEELFLGKNPKDYLKEKKKKDSTKEYTLDEILNDDMIKGEVEREDAELKKAGWSRKDIQGVADFVTKKSTNSDEDEIYFNTIGEQSPTIRMFQRSENYFKNYISNVSNYVGINKFDKEDDTRWTFKNTFYDVKDNDLEFELKDLLNQHFRSKYDLFLINKQLPNIEKKYPNRNFAKKYHQEAHDFYQNKLQNEKSYRATLVAIDYVMQRLKEIKSKPEAKPKNITVSVLRYKSNGNDLIDTKKTIDTIEGIENAFTIKDNEGGYYVVLKLTNNNKTIYFEEGSYSERTVNDFNQQTINQAIERFENNLKDTQTVRHVSKLSLQIAEELGYDYKKLQQLRDAFYKQKREDEVILKQQKEQQKIEAAKTEIENAIKTFTEFAFGNGGIHYDTLEILIKENNLEKPHIRTIGSLRKRNVIFKEQGNSYNYRGTAGYNISTNDPIYNAIEQLKEIYKSNPDKEKRIRLAKAKAKALKVKLSLGQLGMSNKSVKQRIKDLVIFAFENINTSKNKREPINEISEKEANFLKEKTGFDFIGYERILDKSSIIHAYNTHGNRKVEAKRGQIAITKEDFELIPEIVKTKNISNSEKSKNGSVCIIYETVIGDTYYYVEEIRTGKKHLCLKTMYKRKTNH
jgi:hypothetical protein